MWVRDGLAAFLLLSITAAPEARAEAPLSAIDWLSQSVASTPPLAVTRPVPLTPRPAPASPITVAPLEGTSLDALGLLAPAATGLPRDLWGITPSADLVRLVRAERVDTLPAVRSLLLTLLLAEASPPVDSGAGGALYLARVDKLLDMGALEPALALLELPDRLDAESFRRRFDVALLLGQEDAACEVMRDNPQIAPSFPARIFCLARGGDWNAAALSLRTGEALGFIDAPMAALLARFLDPEFAEENLEPATFGTDESLPPPRPSPLVFRMLEAIGEPMPTATLPLAFAHSDLRPQAGWKARVEAGERLARAGAISANQLLGLYTEQEPAASGGVWDRVDAIRALDVAVSARDAQAVAATLPPAWDRMAEVELEVDLAAMYSDALSGIPLDGRAASIAFRLGLLSDDFEDAVVARAPSGAEEAFLAGIARGDMSGIEAAGQLATAIRNAFVPGASPGPVLESLLDGGRTGEALLRAIDDVTDGARGDLRDVTQGLALLRAAGLETTARRAALELMLLERKR
jgi:hypothetical protein